MSDASPTHRRRNARHMHCWPGKRVLVRVRGEAMILDVYVGGGRDYVVLRDRGRVRKEDVEVFTIYKGPKEREHGKSE